MIIRTKRTRGQGLAEYIVIVGLVAMGLVAGVKAFSKKVDDGYGAMAEQVEDKLVDEMGVRSEPEFQEARERMAEQKRQLAEDMAVRERFLAEREEERRQSEERFHEQAAKDRREVQERERKQALAEARDQAAEAENADKLSRGE